MTEMRRTFWIHKYIIVREEKFSKYTPTAWYQTQAPNHLVSRPDAGKQFSNGTPTALLQTQFTSYLVSSPEPNFLVIEQFYIPAAEAAKLAAVPASAE